jgi:signal transduction histidine kinase
MIPSWLGCARSFEAKIAKLSSQSCSVLDKEAKRLLGNIQTNAQKMGTLIDDLLAFSRLGRKEVQKSQVDMQKMVESVLFEIGKSVKHNAAITINPLLITEADHSLLHQVWVNLISNAIKYSPDAKPIDFITDNDEKQGILITVRDHGIGIPEEEQALLFERFFRARNAGNIQGTGLGLNIVKKYIEVMEGGISFSSTLNAGTTFTISIPL